MGNGLDRAWRKLLLAGQLHRQDFLCIICALRLSERHAVLDRIDWNGNFTLDNVRAVHVDCEATILRRRAAGRAAKPMREAATYA